MRKVGPCKILAKYGANAYQVDLLEDMGISTTCKVANLVAYKGPIPSSTQVENLDLQDIVATLSKPSTSKLQDEKIWSSKVKKVTRNRKFMKHLVKWKGKPYSEATWIAEGDIKKHGIYLSLILS